MKRLASSLSLTNPSSSKFQQTLAGVRPKRDDGGAPMTRRSTATASSVHLADVVKQSRISDRDVQMIKKGPFLGAEEPKIVNTTDLEADDIVIAVMGPAGSGKSTFVCAAGGRDTSSICHTLKSHTNQVTAFKFWDQVSRRHIVLVDTPGFNDTFKSDLDVLSMIAEWLVSSYNKKKLLSGILYLHRITDNRVAGSSLKNLRVFRQLCGVDALEKVYLTTTMWDEVEVTVGEQRFEELKTIYWKAMIAKGAQVARCKSDDDSSRKLIQEIILSECSSEVHVPFSEASPSLVLSIESKQGPSPQEKPQRFVVTPKEISTSQPPVESRQGESSQLEAQSPSGRESSVAALRGSLRVMKEPESVNIEDLNVDDIVIAVMGPTGSGKSTFICAASGRDSSTIGHGLKSFTDKVSAVKFWDEESERYVVLVDTPGFDATSKSDFDILSDISNWLISSYKNQIHLSGILYLHPMTSIRMLGTTMKNLRVFRKVCGRDALTNVYLTTTMWDEVELSVGERRIEELRMRCWETMIAKGAQMTRYRRDDDSARRLIQHIVARKAPRKALLIQIEMVDLGRKLKQTTAGRQLKRRGTRWLWMRRFQKSSQ